jgi:hypothetical protein
LSRRYLFLISVLAAALPLISVSRSAAQDSNDLDTLMARVLERRADNWKILHDYVLNEKEHVEVYGPGHTRLFGMLREYTWYLRDGELVRSPVKFDGVAIDAQKRKEYEDNFLKEERHREAREARHEAARDAREAGNGGSSDITALVREGVEPRIISQAYFMKFHFEPGNYYLAGRETMEGREILRIEYYPTHLFDEERRKERERRHQPAKPEDAKERQEEEEYDRMFNKVSLVTLWVDPKEYQIVKFTFDGVDFGFLPGRWLVRADNASASMVMGQPIKGVWLPREISGQGQFTLANGSYEIHYGREFLDYQQGEVRTKIRSFTPKE